MEILTHALIALILARAGQKLLPRYGAAMLLVSGIAADLDFLSYFAGPSAYLGFHRGVLHSVLGSVVLVCALALVSWAVARRRAAVKNSALNLPHLSFVSAVVVCGVGVVVHVFFDLASGIGVRLLWPIREKWTGWDLVSALDPWILVVLVLGLASPEFLRLVSEEIGGGRGPRGRIGAIVTFLVLLIYFGARAGLHSRVVDELSTREYHGAPALAVGAFPSPISPLDWRGVVSTDNDIEVMEISLAPGVGFDPERAARHYKPEDSAALGAAENTSAAKSFLGYARFPLASLERSDLGYRFTLRDVRFAAGDGGKDNIDVRVELGADLRVKSEEFRYANSAER